MTKLFLKIPNVSNICNTKCYTYLCFRDCGEIWTKIITDPFSTTWQSDTPYQQNQQNCVREESGEPDYLQQKNCSS